MIQLQKMKPFSIYKNAVLERIQLENTDKFHGFYFTAFSLIPNFFQIFHLLKPLKYFSVNTRALFIEPYVKLDLPGKAGLKYRTDQNSFYRKAKKEYHAGSVITKEQKEKFSGENVFHVIFNELESFSSVSYPDKKIAELFSSIFLNDIASSRKFGGNYQKEIVIFNLDNIKDLYFLKVFRDVIYYNILFENDKTFLAVSNKENVIILLDTDKKFINRFSNIIGVFKDLAENKNLTKEQKRLFLEKNEEEPSASGQIPSEGLSENQKEIDTEKVRQKILDSLLTSNGLVSGSSEVFSNETLEEVDSVIDSNKNLPEEELVNLVIESISKNKSVISELDRALKFDKQTKKEESLLYNLKEKQNTVTIKVNGQESTVKDINDSPNDFPIKAYEIPDTNISDPEIRNCKTANINYLYKEKLYKKDMLSILQAFNDDKEIPFFIDDISIEDTSDGFNKIETIKVKYRDSKNKSHTLTFDLPKVTDEGYLFLNGSKKFITKQFISLPVVKKKPDEVQITTLYNKAFVNRKGKKLSEITEKIRKFFFEIKHPKIKVTLGNANALNKGIFSSLEFDDLSSDFLKIKIGNIVFNFDRLLTEEKLKEKNSSAFSDFISNHKEAMIFAYYYDKTHFIYSEKDQFYLYEMSGKYDSSKIKELPFTHLSSAISYYLGKIDEELLNEISSISTGKRFAFSTITILRKSIPISVLLSFKDGIEGFLKSANIDYTFEPKRKVLKGEDKLNTGVITFSDGYLYYNSEVISTMLLMNGFSLIATKNYSFNEFNTKEPYLDFFDIEFSSRNSGKGFKNIWERMIDPITSSILSEMNIPNDFSGLLIYCSSLLVDNKYKPAVHVGNYRIRSLELVNHALYQELSQAFNAYKTESKSSSSPNPISIKQDAILKKLIESQNVESLSLLSPVIEMEAMDKTTFKG